tara:strand:- start:881 stop:1108 length:228 start_codon:yes stop_codon:yes gene_type:complete
MEITQTIALVVGVALAITVTNVAIDLYQHRKSVTRDTPVAPDAVATDTPVARNKGGRPKGSKNKPNTKKIARKRA